MMGQNDKKNSKMFFSIHQSVTADLWRLDGERWDCGSRFRVPPLQNGPYEEMFYFFNTCFQQLFEPANFCFDDTARFFVIVIGIVIFIVIESITTGWAQKNRVGLKRENIRLKKLEY